MFKTYNIICALAAIICLVAISMPVQSGPMDSNEIKKVQKCKAYCGSCKCIGFYCGEECICECNDESNDTECIANIQEQAKKDDIPFEILIQGPSKNRFVMNALQYEQGKEQCSAGDMGRTKRSTVVIYKPAQQNTLDSNGYCAKPMQQMDKRLQKQTFRAKRSVENESWFADYSGTVVKPAPLPGRTIKTEIETKQRVIEPDVISKSSIDESEENLLPKLRGKLRNVLTIGDHGVKHFRNKVRKFEDQALKELELDQAAKKIRGAFWSLRNKAEDLLLPSTDGGKSAGRSLFEEFRSGHLSPFRDAED